MHGAFDRGGDRDYHQSIKIFVGHFLNRSKMSVNWEILAHNSSKTVYRFKIVGL